MTTIEDVLKKHDDPLMTRHQVKSTWHWKCNCDDYSPYIFNSSEAAEEGHRLHLGNEIRKILGQPELRAIELTVDSLLAEPCENYTSGSCADDDDPRILGAKYSSEDYCWPCTLRAVLPGKLEEVWDEAAEATAEWMANNPSNGIPHDPPPNPHAPRPEPVKPPKCGECRLGLGTHNEADPYCTHYVAEDRMR